MVVRNKPLYNINLTIRLIFQKVIRKIQYTCFIYLKHQQFLHVFDPTLKQMFPMKTERRGLSYTHGYKEGETVSKEILNRQTLVWKGRKSEMTKKHHFKGLEKPSQTPLPDYDTLFPSPKKQKTRNSKT